MEFKTVLSPGHYCDHQWEAFTGGWGGLNRPTHSCTKCGASKVSGYQPYVNASPGVAIVGLTTFRDRLFVATSAGVYEFINEVLVPLKFQEIPPEEKL